MLPKVTVSVAELESAATPSLWAHLPRTPLPEWPTSLKISADNGPRQKRVRQAMPRNLICLVVQLRSVLTHSWSEQRIRACPLVREASTFSSATKVERKVGVRFRRYLPLMVFRLSVSQ